MRRRIIQRLKNDRGAMSVLTLLLIFALLALIGMIWNTTEVAMKRQYMQAAADSTAHSAANLMSRSLNLVTAQNIVISQDASAEAIWRAVPPTDDRINTELTNELTALQNWKDQLQALQTRITNALNKIDAEAALTDEALTAVEGAGAPGFDNPQDAAMYKDKIRQAREVFTWVQQSYMDGQDSPHIAGRPYPPGPNQEGLRKTALQWPNITTAQENAIVQLIIQSITTEQYPTYLSFHDRTYATTLEPVSAEMDDHEQKAFETQMAMVDGVPTAIERQRQQTSDYYKADLTLATLQNDGSTAGTAQVPAPIMPAANADPVTGYTDSIRAAYPDEAAAAGLPITFDIDAISPHTRDPSTIQFGRNGQTTSFDPYPPGSTLDARDDARIWHPPQQADVPPDLQAQYPGLATQFTVNCGTDWGSLWVFPLQHYLRNRVSMDQEIINDTYMVVIDNYRQALAQKIRLLLGLTNTDNLEGLPGQIIDSQPDPNGKVNQIPVLLRLKAPANAPPKLSTQITTYNQHGGAYTAAIRDLLNVLRTYSHTFDQFTVPFAVIAWQSNVGAGERTVMYQLGNNKRFMVLSTYKLAPIPDWAQDGMRASATVSAHDAILTMNVRSVQLQVLNVLVKLDPSGYGAGYLDPNARDAYLRGMYSAQAAKAAVAIIEPVAQRVAPVVAAEMVNRPWPYEFTPPDDPVPPSRGMPKPDRQQYFTVIAAARQQDASAPKYVLSKYFGKPKNKLVTYAQAESVNWMEYNNAWGGTARYDQVTSRLNFYSYYSIYYTFMCCPPAWRMCSVGGWNWQPRLTLSYALPDAINANPELQQYLQDSGVSNFDRNAINTINLH